MCLYQYLQIQSNTTVFILVFGLSMMMRKLTSLILIYSQHIYLFNQLLVCYQSPGLMPSYYNPLWKCSHH